MAAHSYDQKPAFSLGPDQLICPGNIIHLQPDLDPSWTFQWLDGTTDPDFKITAAGSYLLKASNFCGTGSDEIIVHPGICQVFVPNAFTPNGDGKNDQFRILGIEKVTSLHLLIFNRWGEKIFETRDKHKSWDGKINGKQVPAGNYIYMLEFTDVYSVEVQKLKGNFILIR